MNKPEHILITGAGGYIGLQLGHRLSQTFNVTGIDITPPAQAPFAIYPMDIRARELATFMQQHKITHVIHLASVVQPSRDQARDFDIDVNGTRNLLEACIQAGVEHITVTSSGAAYGYHADNPEWLQETDPLRGNGSFSYAAHKCLVEKILQDYRQQYPGLKQLIFRPGTVLGANTNNLITRLFQGRFLLTVSHAPSPFVFIWDQDLVAVIEQGVSTSRTGIYNLAGDGAVTMKDIAALCQKPVINLPAWLLGGLLWLGKTLRLTRYGPDQVNFLRYRPVLSNRALKQEFGYTPQKTSRETLLYFLAAQEQQRP